MILWRLKRPDVQTIPARCALDLQPLGTSAGRGVNRVQTCESFCTDVLLRLTLAAGLLLFLWINVQKRTQDISGCESETDEETFMNPTSFKMDQNAMQLQHTLGFEFYARTPTTTHQRK